MRRYIVTWKHDFGGANSEQIYAVSPEKAITQVMSKYDMRYHFYSVRLY